MLSIGLPTSTVRIPSSVEAIGPMVDRTAGRYDGLVLHRDLGAGAQITEERGGCARRCVALLAVDLDDRTALSTGLCRDSWRDS